MEIFSDGNLLARVLLTLATIGYGVITVKADFNPTHATNPLWTPHARFHVVWQITSYVGFGLLAFALIWTPGAYKVERLYLAAGFGGVVTARSSSHSPPCRFTAGGPFSGNVISPFPPPPRGPRLA